MRRKFGRLLAFGLIMCLLAVCGTASAESMHTEIENPSLEAEVLLGYDGRITYGKAVPVRVTIRNNGEDLEGILAVNGYVSGVEYDRFESEIFVPAGGERTAVLPVTVMSVQETFTAEIVQDGEVILAVNASPDSVINPSAMLIGVLSSRPRNLANLDITQENDALYRYEYWQTVALTPETLPEDKGLLNSFAMIVLDDTDPASLTEKQQQALRDWVQNGHTLICGGGTTAPQNLTLTGDMTGLRAGDFAVSDQVVSALENYTGQKDSGHTPEIALAVLEGEKPLIADENGNGLVWRKTAGSGCIYTLAWEAGDAALNTESILHTFFQQMLLREDSNLYNDMLYNSDDEGAEFVPDEEMPLNLKNPMPLEAAVIAVCILLACAAWLILRKHGKTQWMWAILPALSVAAAGAALLFAGGSSMNSPVAAVTVNLLQDQSGAMTRYTGVMTAAPGNGLHSYTMEGEQLDLIMYDSYYEEDEEDKAVREPATLRAVYRSGNDSEVAVNAETPWDSFRFAAVRPEEDHGRVDAEIWMENDGLHGSIHNGLTFGLKEGGVVCPYGFVKIPALAPGEEADFVLLSETAKDPYDPPYESGKMFMNASGSIYQVVSQMLFGRDREGYEGRKGTISDMMCSAADRFASQNRRAGTIQGDQVFVYCAESEEDFTAPVRADGRETEGKGGLTMISTEIRYLTIGKTGVVFHAPGMDRAIRCEIDGQGMPAGDMQVDMNSTRYYDYYLVDETPTFRFHPEGIEDVKIDQLVIGVEEWYVNDLHSYVLNTRLNKWVEITPNTALQQPEQFLDADGNLYCQFRPKTPGDYMSIPAPTLTVSGKLKTK